MSRGSVLTLDLMETVSCVSISFHVVLGGTCVLWGYGWGKGLFSGFI